MSKINEQPQPVLQELERLALAVFLDPARLALVLDNPTHLAPEEREMMRKGVVALQTRRQEILAGAALRKDEAEFSALWLRKYAYVDYVKAQQVDKFVRCLLAPDRMHEPAAGYLRACAIAIHAPLTQTPAADKPGEHEQQLQELAAKGLLCPNRGCRSPKSKVNKTVPKGNVTVRYRECLRCGATFTSEEKLRFGEK